MQIYYKFPFKFDYLRLENVDKVINLLLVVLRDALCDPDNVANLLLLELDEGVEDGAVALAHVHILVYLHLKTKGRK